MRYTFTTKAIEEMVMLTSLCAEENTKAVLTLGKKVVQNQVVNAIRVTTTSEQLVYQFISAIPEGFKEGVEFAVDANKLTRAFLSLLSFDADVYLDIEDTSCSCGVKGKASVPLSIASEAPQMLAPGKSLFVGKADAKEFSAFIRRGCSCTSDKSGANGAENAFWSVDTTTGAIMAMSTDGVTFAKTEGQIILPDLEGAAEQLLKAAEERNALLSEHLKKSGETPDGLSVKVPGKSCVHMRTILDKSVAVKIAISERQVQLGIGNSIVYTAVQAVNCPLEKEYAQILENKGGLAIGLDNDELSKSVEFIMKAGGLDADNNQFKPITFSVTDKLELSAGKTGALKTNVPYVKTEGEVLNDIAIAGKSLKSILHSLDKGNICIRFVKGRENDDAYNFVIFRSGTIDEPGKDNTLIGRPQVTVSKIDSSKDDVEEG